MRTFAITATNDIAILNGGMSLSSGIDAVLLVARHCAQAILGEMVFAANQGMPYFETVWVGAPTTAPFEAAFRERILQITGVIGIDALETWQEGDVMRYTATISTEFGTGEVSG